MITPSIYLETTTKKAIALMRQGIDPWAPPWEPPQDGMTGKPFIGFNGLFLSLAGRGYGDPRWYTRKQAKMLEGKVSEGEKALPIFLTTDMQASGGNAGTNPVFRVIAVFNRRQTKGILEKQVRMAPDRKAADAFIPNMAGTDLTAKDALETEERYISMFQSAASDTGSSAMLRRKAIGTGIHGADSALVEEATVQAITRTIADICSMKLTQGMGKSHLLRLADLLESGAASLSGIYKDVSDAIKYLSYGKESPERTRMEVSALVRESMGKRN